MGLLGLVEVFFLCFTKPEKPERTRKATNQKISRETEKQRTIKPAPCWSLVSGMRAGGAKVFVWPSSIFVTSSDKRFLTLHDLNI